MPDKVSKNSCLCMESGNGNVEHVHETTYNYKECLKNHAAAIGGNATDGCREFMPGGQQGTLEALKCSACNCHRNFHRKEMQGFDYSSVRYHSALGDSTRQMQSLGHHKGEVVDRELVGYPTGTLVSTRTAAHQMIVPYKMGVVCHSSSEVGKKRLRTKFSREQKEKMLSFAEKAGWKLQKLEEGAVHNFCQEIGIKRRVLKVWMHNNKHLSLAKKTTTSTI
ncbi:homeobox protein 21 [Actinidia rufa]|uniref:Homeobox protein 21 n=1 Tax=Actinidia rufa TaxID=165716 RepID=A0A7J0H6H9_9ERIC|nr:homeobox protein 21 [Actinidia rufa]